jgi:hypothetical protein
MILDEFIEIKWHASNKKYLVDLGYIYTGIGTVVLIKVCDLKKRSHCKLHVKCDICGNEKILSYKTYNKNIKSGGYYGCSDKCSIDKYNNTNLLRYGVKRPTDSKEILEKTRQTCLKKYGVNCTLQSENVKIKVIKTTIKNFGTNHHTQSPKFQEMVKKNSLEKYGVESFLTTEEFKNKTKQTCLERYGVENPLESELIKEKIKKTCLEKYGYENPLESELIKEKIKKSNLEKYGFEFSHQNKKVSEKTTNTMIERYGEIWLKHCPTYNANSIIYLDMISEKLNIPIQHALNGGEKKFIRYWIDGYIEKYNICIEWDEKYHKYKKFNKKDNIRESFLKENFNCQIIRINQKEFLKDVDNEISLVCNKINNFIKNSYNGKPI